MLWRQPEKQVVYETKKIEVLVPVYTTDNRLYEDKWNDPEYLKEVSLLVHNAVFVGEVIQALSELRHTADETTTPDKLAGCQEGIKVLKNILLLSEKAKRKLQLINESKEQKNDVDYSAR